MAHNVLSKLVGLLPLPWLVVLLPLEHFLGSVLPLVALLHLVVPRLEDVEGGVDDVGRGLAVVLLLAVAETQRPLAAHLR